MWVPSLCWEDPLEKDMATHFSILACSIPRTEEFGRLLGRSSWGCKELDMTEVTEHTCIHFPPMTAAPPRCLTIRILVCVCVSVCVCVCVCESHSAVSDFATLWTGAH